MEMNEMQFIRAEEHLIGSYTDSTAGKIRD